MYVREVCGASVMFESPGQSGRPTLQANVVRGPSPGPKPRSRSVSPSRGGAVRKCQLEVEVLLREWVPEYRLTERLEWCGETGGGSAEYCSGGYGEGSGNTVTSTRSTTPFAASPTEEWAQSSSTTTPTCMYCGQMGNWMMGCAERLANEARIRAGAMVVQR